MENANDITFTINSILGEALDDVMTRIEADFASSGADQMEVKNPYSSGPVYNANLIISQYCAARDEDFESISLDDLAAVLRENTLITMRLFPPMPRCGQSVLPAGCGI